MSRKKYCAPVREFSIEISDAGGEQWIGGWSRSGVANSFRDYSSTWVLPRLYDAVFGNDGGGTVWETESLLTIH
jgi:hypothetical protein